MVRFDARLSPFAVPGTWKLEFLEVFWIVLVNFLPSFCLFSFWTSCWMLDPLSESFLNFPSRLLLSDDPPRPPVALLAL